MKEAGVASGVRRMRSSVKAPMTKSQSTTYRSKAQLAETAASAVALAERLFKRISIFTGLWHGKAGSALRFYYCHTVALARPLLTEKSENLRMASSRFELKVF